MREGEIDCTGPDRTQGDYHETEPKTNQTREQGIARRHRNKRTRENGTSGGTRAGDTEHGHTTHQQ